jgi:hypothetical protein
VLKTDNEQYKGAANWNGWSAGKVNWHPLIPCSKKGILERSVSNPSLTELTATDSILFKPKAPIKILLICVPAVSAAMMTTWVVPAGYGTKADQLQIQDFEAGRVVDPMDGIRPGREGIVERRPACDGWCNRILGSVLKRCDSCLLGHWHLQMYFSRMRPRLDYHAPCTSLLQFIMLCFRIQSSV